MIGVYAFRNSLPLNGVTSMPFRPGCHRPFHRSVRLRSLPLLSWVSLLFVWFLSFLLLLSPTYASACSHFNRRHSPTLRPVFIQLAHTVFFVEGAGFEPAMSYAFSPPIRGSYPFFSGYSSVAFDHSAILPSLSCALRFSASIIPFQSSASAGPEIPPRPASAESSSSDSTTPSCGSRRLPLSPSRTPSAASAHTCAATPS